MKLVTQRRILIGVLALTLALAPVAGPAYAQSRQTDPKVQYPAQELELLRGKLIELTDAVKDLSVLLADSDEQVKKLDQARTAFEQLSLQDLKTYRAALDPARMNAGLVEARATIAEYTKGIDGHSRIGTQRGATANSAGLPERPGPDSVCDALIGSGRPSSDLASAADTVYYTAEGVHALANRGCNQLVVLVVLGEGGGSNGSLACIAADVVLALAKVLRDKIKACSDDFSKRTLDTSYERLDHIHTDLEGSVANDNANRTAIVANDNANRTAIVNNDNSNRMAIVNNDNTNTSSIIANANANKGDVIVNANSNTATIVATTSAAKVELRDLILRTQIEADLASTSDSNPAALFETPTANGGYLNLVRTIVSQTIVNIQAAGGGTGQAQSLLAQGDTFKNAGDFKRAYVTYQQAYKSAVQ